MIQRDEIAFLQIFNSFWDSLKIYELHFTRWVYQTKR